VPFPLRRPILPMLSRAETTLPNGEGWLYEPKYDGFRALVFRDADRVEIDSRNGKALTPYFADLAESLRAALPNRCVLDGEIVACRDDGLDFENLQARLARMTSEPPLQGVTAFIAFDLLAVGNDDLTRVMFSKRRTVLQQAIREQNRVVVTPQTDSADAAQPWLTAFSAKGIEGVVAKRQTQLYEPGRRVMIKVRRQRLVDCVVGGFVPGPDGLPMQLVLGLYDRCGVLHHVGQTSVLSQDRRQEAARVLRRYLGRRSFRDGRMPGRSRWAEQRDLVWIAVAPRLACEVATGNIDDGRFRHAARLVRWRPDRDPTSCTYSQLS
jgi:ATP-dependent DNA ligase